MNFVIHDIQYTLNNPLFLQPPIVPQWMEYLKASLTSRDQPENCRAFIVKLILNCQSYFKPLARYWILPILECVNDKCLGDNMNFLIHDIVSLHVKSTHSVVFCRLTWNWIVNKCRQVLKFERFFKECNFFMNWTRKKLFWVFSGRNNVQSGYANT